MFNGTWTFALGQFVRFPTVKMLNTKIISKVNIKDGVLVSCLGFGAIQNCVSKRNMFRQLWIKAEKKVCLKLCVIETRVATDTVLNKSIKIKNTAEIIETLHRKEWSPWLLLHVVKSLKPDWDHVLFALYLSFCQQTFAFSRLFQTYHLNYSSYSFFFAVYLTGRQWFVFVTWLYDEVAVVNIKALSA